MAQALSLAPQTVAQSLEGLVVAAWIFAQAGFETSPGWNEPRTDTIQAIKLGSVQAQRVFCKAVQSFGLVDSRATPVPVVQPVQATVRPARLGSSSYGHMKMSKFPIKGYH